ncbi:PDR/VanB family oxidoreductase [Xenophilus arseniciresistens]|uniref:PDR/VanB family oxidoreductase n=1 Tax=Xenophilus arseniciresistens TaxID=1283306 RepID=A0AAE3T380_9BURK|nr:PDR/VanB family oxidoreductase [Xenophilus arseniciresistens]MDA7419197.1 PDR/VanB family oxidoreductase [Xenophilus arseniciresistens]
MRLILQQLRREAEGIVSYEFVAADGGLLPPFTAGAHIDLQLPGGLVRSYSLANAPSERHRYVVAVDHASDSRGGSAWMHTVPRPGHVFDASAPINDFALYEDAPLSIFIAGGIGITPFVAMVARLQALGRSWQLHYTARSRQRAAYAQALNALAHENGTVDLRCTADGMARPDIAAIVREAPAGAHLYCCGPGGMLDAFTAACAGLPPQRVHLERFAASQEAATEGGYEVQLARSGRTLQVEPGRTLLDTLLDAGVQIQYACSQGICGTCCTPVIEGRPDHRDDYLTDEEKSANRAMMVCCSGSLSARLVLDL